jgi:ribosome-associated heat shock protein Hsp15
MTDRVRLDSWLWAARFFKTRSLAAEAIDGGRVDVNGDDAKRSKAIKPGDEIRIRIGPYHHHVVVRGLAERLKLQAPIFHQGRGRPTKKQRREIDRWRDRD